MTSLAYQHRFEPGSDPGAPPLLLLHGTGGNEDDLLPLARQLSPGSALLSPRGDVLEQGMPRFFRRFAEGVFDLADVAKRTQAMADFVAAAAIKYRFDPARLTAVGFSNGANLAASLLLLRPAALAGAALWRPMVVLAAPPGLKLPGKRVLITSGRHDPIVPAGDPPRLADLFRSAGAEVTLNWLESGHQPTGSDLTATKEFLGAPEHGS